MIVNIIKKITVIGTLFVSTHSFAQRHISVAPDVNLNVLILPKNGLSNPIFLTPRFGVKGDYYFNPKFSVGTGFYFTNKKIQYHSEFTEPTPTLNSILSLLNNIQGLPFDATKAFNTDSKIVENGVLTEHFIEIPLLANYHTKNIVFTAGGYAGFLTGVKNKQVKETSIPFVETINYNEIAGPFLGNVLTRLSPPAYAKETTTTNNKNGLSKSDFGIIMGVGYEFKNVTFNISYAQGFKDYRVDKGSEPKVLSRIIRFSVAYNFNFKLKKREESLK